MTSDERINAIATTRTIIENNLVAPRTAKFGPINAGKIEGETIVQGYVDSQNSFGANVRSNFQAKYNKDGELKSLIIDGKEMLK